MGVTDPFWDYWFFHLPNYLIAALIYTLLARLLLGLFVPPDWDNYIWRFFRRVTDPVLHAVAVVTPRFVHPALLPLVAVFWLYAARLAFWLVLYQFGLTPTIRPAPATG